MGNPTKALWCGLALVMLAIPSPAVDDLYASQIVEQARQWQQKNRDDLAAGIWRKLLISDPKHPEALVKLGIIEARAGNLGQAESLLHRAMQLSPAPGRLQDLSDAVKLAKGSAPASKDTPKTVETQPKLSPKEPPKKAVVSPEPTVREAPSGSLPSSQPKKSGQAAPAKLSKSTGQPLGATETIKPKAAGETELNFSSSLDPIQVKPRP